MMHYPTADFSINSTSGAVTVRDLLDRESVPRYELTVEAMDGGTPSLTNVVDLNIDIIDENDNSPYFERSYYTTSVEEGEKKQLLGKISKFNSLSILWQQIILWIVQSMSYQPMTLMELLLHTVLYQAIQEATLRLPYV